MIREAGPEEFIARAGELLDIYAIALRVPPAELTGRRAMMAGHARNPGFRALIAERAAGQHGTAAGFCYGFHGAAGQWWHDQVRAGLGQDWERWLGDCVEVAELHVLPGHQRNGTGSELLARLAQGRPERTAVLSTQDADTPARRLYRRAGFTDLVAPYRFAGTGTGYAIMGATLPLAWPDLASARAPAAGPSPSAV